MYPAQRKRSFCSDPCRNRDAATAYVVGACKCGCGEPVLGRKDEMGGKKQFVNHEHLCRFLEEQQLGETGCFRPCIEWYMAGDARNRYKASTLHTVKSSLARFFRFAATEGITDINDIRPATITKFIAAELERGTTSRNYVGHLSTFFYCLIDEGLYERPCPVIARRHALKSRGPRPRPYTDAEVYELRAVVEAGGKPELMLLFELGLECGLGGGEASGVQLFDVDQRAQRIFIRYPTKRHQSRWVPYHDGVKRCLSLWLERRSRHCPTDHLLHNQAHNPFTHEQVAGWFRRLFREQGEPMASFRFHRLRHTWATRLMNNGMELAVLKELGGWKNWNSVQCYIQVLPATIRRQYAAAYKALQEKQEAAEDESLSLFDFAAIAVETTATPSDKAA